MAQSGARQRFTLDSNLLIYSVDSTAGNRHALAMQIALAATTCDCWLTLQAVSEFYTVTTRKGIVPPTEAAARANDWLIAFPHRALSADAVRAALNDAASGRASYWDALMIATAAEAGCTLILTEDLQHGSTLSGVEIHNPFDPAGGITARARQLLGL